MRLATLSLVGAVGLSLIAQAARAEAPVSPGQWFVTGGYGGYRFENRDINDDKGGPVVGVGRRFGDWGLDPSLSRCRGFPGRADGKPLFLLASAGEVGM